MAVDLLQHLVEAVGEPYAAPGSGLTDEQAKLLVAACKRIEASEGGITMDRLLAEVQRPDDPLHDLLDWDMERAAANYWKDELRRKLRLIRVQIVTQTQDVVEGHYFISTDAEDGGRRYNTAATILNDEERRTDALRRALAAFAQARDNLLIYPEAEGLLKATERPLKALRRGGYL